MNSPIGIFDSGVGGTSIWKELQQLLPNENTIYLADSINAPYGEKSKEKILELSIKNTEFLLSQGCKIIVVACNTATTNAIEYLRARYKVPFIGIEPAIKPAALQTKTKKIGVLATKGTLSSALFFNTSKLHAQGIEIIEQEGTGLVGLIETGKIDSEEMKTKLVRFLEPMLKQNIDCLVLGCTHYPYLIPTLEKILPAGVKIIDSGEAVARQVKAVLEQNQLQNKEMDFLGEYMFFSNTTTNILETLVNNKLAKISFLDF